MKNLFILVALASTSVQAYGIGFFDATMLHQTCNTSVSKNELNEAVQALSNKGYKVQRLENEYSRPKGNIFLSMSQYECYEIPFPSENKLFCYYNLNLYEENGGYFIANGAEKLASVRTKIDRKSEFLGDHKAVVIKYYLKLIDKLPNCRTYN